jgi:CHAT domain-containing protein
MFQDLAFGFRFGRPVRNILRLTLLVCASFLFAQLISDKAHADGSFSQQPATDAQNAREILTLEAGKPIEREMAGGQKHFYQIALTEGQYLNAIVEQRGIDVVVRCLGPDGKQIAEFDSESRLQGEEKAELVAETAGHYRLMVEARQQKASAGGYTILFAELRAATEKDRSLQQARCLYAESISLRRAGKYREALAPGERALEIREKALGVDHPNVANALNNLAIIYRNAGDFAKAESLNRRALEILEKSLGPDHPQVAASLDSLATLYSEKGDFAKAEPLYQRALEIKEKSLGPSHLNVAASLNSLAIIHRNRGDFTEAETLYQRALEIWEKELGPDHPNVANSLNNLANLYKDRGDYVKAEPLYLRAVEIQEKTLGPQHPQIASSLYNLATLYSEKGDFAKAEPLYQRAVEIEEKSLGPNHPGVASSLHSLASLYSNRGDYVKAEQLYHRALEIWEKSLGLQHPNVATSLNSLANLYSDKGDYVKAEPLYRQALEIWEKSLGPQHPNVAAALDNLASLYAAKGEFDQAIASQLRANAITERNLALNLATGSERQKLAYLTSLSKTTDRALSLGLRAAPDNAEAQELAAMTILQRKGRALDAMSDSLTTLRQRLTTEAQSLLDQLQKANSQLARLVLNGPQRMTLEEHQKRIRTLEEQREKLENEISLRSAGFYDWAAPVTLAAIQAAIPPNAALIEFATYRPFDPKADDGKRAYGEPRYVACILRRQGQAQWKELGEAKEIDDAVDELRQALRDPERSDVKRLARVVDAKVMQPLRSLTVGTTQLLASPDGALNLIPFEALVDEQGRFLVERFSFTYLTSGRDLLRLQVVRESKSAPLVLANPMFGEPDFIARAKADAPKLRRASPVGKRQSITTGSNLSDVYFAPLAATAQEAKAIKSIFAETRLLTGAQATETSLKQVTAPRILHIATHGFFLTDGSASSGAGRSAQGLRAISANVRIENPLLRSGLALAGANLHKSGDDDGILTALEASGLNLWGTKLVTLSACDTGVGEVIKGEGVYGLRRAFVLAGAETLVMSLWPVSDYVTREMMIEYYKGLKQGQGRGEALRRVQLAMLRRKDREHPFYWASFIQAGEWADLNGKR